MWPALRLSRGKDLIKIWWEKRRFSRKWKSQKVHLLIEENFYTFLYPFSAQNSDVSMIEVLNVLYSPLANMAWAHVEDCKNFVPRETGRKNWRLARRGSELWYCLLIGWDGSRDLDPGLWLVDTEFLFILILRRVPKQQLRNNTSSNLAKC